ncbi:hypothetical protein [Sporofaciens musculi]|uniref:hypothetical protein n=1 Tax=Sporofaciens musculi TaxID=2681861 RepID=UPI001FCB7474|nr:hypothetical protein [Sporofaciens musculi]
MLDVIIPSAKLIPEELQKIGKLPAVIYPVNQRIVFDYIYNQYRNVDSRFTVIGGENCGLLYKALSRYDSNKVDIMNLDTISDLGHTVYVALKDEQETVVINFGDTIVLEDVYDKNTDAIFCALDDVSSTWTFFEEEEGILTQIYDKINIAEKIQKKLFVGVFRISNVKDFRESLEYAFDNPITDISSFYTALQIYSRRHPFSFVYTDHWLDIGHADKYYSSKLEVNAREFNHISIDKNRGILRKTSDNIEKFIDEIKWYLKLPSDVEYVRPRIFEYSTDYSMPYISMEYYAYHTIHELYLYGDLNRNQWSDIFKRIRFVLQDFSRYSVQGEGILDSLSDIYINKTIERVNELKKSSEFISFFEKA